MSTLILTLTLTLTLARLGTRLNRYYHVCICVSTRTNLTHGIPCSCDVFVPMKRMSCPLRTCMAIWPCVNVRFNVSLSERVRCIFCIYNFYYTIFLLFWNLRLFLFVCLLEFLFGCLLLLLFSTRFQEFGARFPICFV